MIPAIPHMCNILHWHIVRPVILLLKSAYICEKLCVELHTVCKITHFVWHYTLCVKLLTNFRCEHLLTRRFLSNQELIALPYIQKRLQLWRRRKDKRPDSQRREIHKFRYHLMNDSNQHKKSKKKFSGVQQNECLPHPWSVLHNRNTNSRSCDCRQESPAFNWQL